MTPDILPLLAASFACFSALALFARQNQRNGWVKPRVAASEEASWKSYPAPVRSGMVVLAAGPLGARLPERPSPSDLTNFTLQLANFQRSLAVAAPKHVEERERVNA